MPNSLEHTTMYAVARLLWEDNVETWGVIPMDSPYHWDNLADSVRQKYYKRAVRIIDAAEPVWRQRVGVDIEAAKREAVLEYKESVRPDFSDMEFF